MLESALETLICNLDRLALHQRALLPHMLPRAQYRLLGRFNCSTRFFWLLPIIIVLNGSLLRYLLNRRLLQLSRRIITFLRCSVYFTSLLNFSRLIIFGRWNSLNVDSATIDLVAAAAIESLLLDLFTARLLPRLLDIAASLDYNIIGIWLLIIILSLILEGTAAHFLISSCFKTCLMPLKLWCGRGCRVWDSLAEMIHGDHLIEHLELILWRGLIHRCKLIWMQGFSARFPLFKSAPASWVRPRLWLEADSWFCCGYLRVLFDEMLWVIQ